MSSPRAAFTADDVIGGYQLVRPAGKGGMAEVWLARKGGRGRPVALKVVLPHLAGEPRYSRMFRTEAEVSGLMSHSNVVQCFDEGEDQGVSFLVMEWVEGINLVRLREALKLIDSAPVRHGMVAFVIGQLLHALSYAHQLTDPSGVPLGIVHRDISPQNVLVSTAGDVKLLDFGVAHTVIEESSGLHVKGKLRYMAPEQLTTRSKAPTLDLYGVGALLHELLDGKRFRGEFKDDRQLHAQVMRGVAPILRTPAPPALEQLRASLLAPDPAARPQSAMAALELLSRFEGYRDCRVELSKVVGSLMGSSRPRSAVEPSRASAPSRAPTPAPIPSPASTPAPAPVAPAMAPAAAPPERTMFIEGGGLPSSAAQVESTTFLPNPAAGGQPGPIQEPTAFLPGPNAAHDAAESTEFIAPPSPHGPAHASTPAPVSTPRAAPFGQPRPAHHAAVAAAAEPSMTRFVVEERGVAKTILMFVAGLVLALCAAGAAAYFILDAGEQPSTSE